MLNEHFVNAPSALPLSHMLASLLWSVVDPYSDDKFYFSDIDQIDVMRTFSTFSSNAKSSDQLTLRYFRLSLPVVLLCIVDLFNRSLKTSIFPTQWKSALVVSIKKIRDPTLPCHYRPISILCTLSKVLERLVYKQLWLYLDLSGKLDLYQTGFRVAHSRLKQLYLRSRMMLTSLWW